MREISRKTVQSNALYLGVCKLKCIIIIRNIKQYETGQTFYAKKNLKTKSPCNENWLMKYKELNSVKELLKQKTEQKTKLMR